MMTDAAIAEGDTAVEPAAPSLPVFNSRRIVVGGLSLNVVAESGRPDVMLIHGFPDSHQVWRKEIPALVAAGCRVIAPNLRGYGAGDTLSDETSYAVEPVVADLVGVLDVLGVAKSSNVLLASMGCTCV